MTLAVSELLNKRQRATDYELPYLGYELPYEGHELLYTDYEPTNYEPTRRDYELRATTLPGYVSKTRPKLVSIDALPTELIQ